MAERSRRAGLLLEAAQAVLIMSQGGFQYLEGNFPPQSVVAGAVHFPHPSRAYVLHNSVVSKDSVNHRKAGRGCSAC